MAAEISGDGRLTATARLRYLAVNFARNLRRPNRAFRRETFCAARLTRTPASASPGRTLTEAFLHQRLPLLLRPGRIRVLEIGCGSGSLTRLLAEAGYSGEYVGVDINNRFVETAEPEFTRTFVQADVHEYQTERRFDLVVSISALEHISHDREIITRLRELVAPGGLQLHFVPSGWGLPVYWWHGYRQYTSASLAERFDPAETTLVALGGAASFLLHFFCISVSEFVFGIRLRRAHTRGYTALLDRCLRADRLAPICPTTYAVCQPSRSRR